MERKREALPLESKKADVRRGEGSREREGPRVRSQLRGVGPAVGARTSVVPRLQWRRLALNLGKSLKRTWWFEYKVSLTLSNVCLSLIAF